MRPIPAVTDFESGLTTADAARRLAADGYNELPQTEQRGILRIAGEVIRQPMFALLLGGGLVYLLLGDRTEALLLMLFASLSVSITVVQETRSERVLEALRNLASPRATVIRDGQPVTVAGREVVRGDLMLVNEGDRVAADGLLASAQDLLANESLLTGEAMPVNKRAATQAECASLGTLTTAPGGEQQPVVFAGTLVVRGTGFVRVTATGLGTEMGRIGGALRTIELEQPRLQVEVGRFVRRFATLGLAAGIVAVALFGLLRGAWLEALLSGIALGMSLLPEEFPLVLTVFMAMGAWRISRARVLTRRAAAIETLGATTVLCTDKTGTLTENRMTVEVLVGGGQRWRAGAEAVPTDELQALLESALRACPQHPIDPMDRAVHACADRHLAGTTRARGTPLRHYGLTAELLAVGNLVREPCVSDDTLHVKGALEAVATLCGLDASTVQRESAVADELAAEGVRVLGVARARVQPGTGPSTLAAVRLEYLGLIGFTDPLRANVPGAVAECHAAGIRVLMITGDYPATAQAIARQAGIPAEHVLTGDDLAALDDATLAVRVRDSHVFARIRPTQKLRIVQSLKANGEVVAMTGDGVNDAPAIKAAHIGIAMGGRGTDVAREASSIVLLDDDFGSMVEAIRLGRRIYDNLRKAMLYIIAVHIPIAGLAILPLLLGLPLILTPVLIAFLEMVIDPACSVVFEAEAAEHNVMRRRPRDPAGEILPRGQVHWACAQGALVFAVLAALLIGALRAGVSGDALRTVVFCALVATNVGLILVNRTFTSTLRGVFARPNRALVLLTGVVCAVLAVTVYWPPAQRLFGFVALDGTQVGLCALVGALCMAGLQWLKREPVESTR